MMQERQPNSQNPVNRFRVPFPWEKQPGVNPTQPEEVKKEIERLERSAEEKPTTPPTPEEPRLQTKKIPVEAQAIWKELVHEERLNKRLGKGRELISVLNKMIYKQIVGPQGPKGETGEKGEVGPQGPKGEKPRKAWVPGAIIAGILGTIAIVIALNGDGKTDQAIVTPTPSSAAGEPTPSPTVEPTATLTPEPTEVLKVPNFGVKYNPNTGECAAVDKNTGNVVDDSNALSIQRISYQETGVGVRKDITTTLQPGQTAIIQGWKVDGQGDGVFKAITATGDTLQFSANIADGAVEVIDSQDGPSVFCRAVNIAVKKGYAHQKIEIPDEWKVD